MKYCIVYNKAEKNKEIIEKLKNEITADYDEENPNYVITLGGDGTIIRAFHEYPDAIIFAVHVGHLGFYTNYQAEEVDMVIDAINNHKYKVSALNLLNVSFKQDDKEVVMDALNEITIISLSKTLILDIFIDNNYLERFRGTGVCVCTPTGSTAYNKSLNGAVIDFNIDAIELTEIAGINSNSYRTLASPLVLSKDRVIRLVNVRNDEAHLTLDNMSFDLKNGEEVTVKMSQKIVKMAFTNREPFVNRLNRAFLISKKKEA